MPKDLFSALTSVAQRLISLASEDMELRSHLRQLAQAVLEATEIPETERPSAPAAAEQAMSHEAPQPLFVAGERDQIKSAEREPPTRAEVSAASPGPLPELTLGQSGPSEEPPAPSYPDRWALTTDADFPLIAARCRLKAEGARWAATRRRLLSEGATFATDIDPRDREIIARAKMLPDCFLWMCHPSGPSPSDLRQYEPVAVCFEVMADILAVLEQIQDEPDLHPKGLFEQALDLLAEAQSALRVAIQEIGAHPDTDQLRVFNWLKATASKNQIFIQRYMRADDPADPSQWADLSSRIEAIDSAIAETRRRASQRRKLLGKVRHRLSLIADDPDDAGDHWQRLAEVVDELVSDGLPPSNRELRELLVPAIDDLPELSELPKGFQLVLREIDRFLATCLPPEVTRVTQPTPEVRKVKRLLEGRSMVLIGGQRRPGSQQALQEAFGLRELIWIEAREHQSIDGFEPYIARPDVAVVMLAIRWSSHSFGEVVDFCERHGKPLVRLPGGYNPNQVAVQILAQCSERLKRE